MAVHFRETRRIPAKPHIGPVGSSDRAQPRKMLDVLDVLDPGGYAYSGGANLTTGVPLPCYRVTLEV